MSCSFSIIIQNHLYLFFSWRQSFQIYIYWTYWNIWMNEWIHLNTNIQFQFTLWVNVYEDMFPGGFPTKFKHQTFPPLTLRRLHSERFSPQSYRARCVAQQQRVICKADNMKMIPTRTLNETKQAGWQVATLQWALLQFSAGTKVVARHGEGGGLWMENRR